MTRPLRRRIAVAPLTLPHAGFDALALEARAEGLRFLNRLEREWASGMNRFDAAGEILLGATVGETVVGLGGLNRDSFAGDARVARIRHVYARADQRRRGNGTLIMHALVERASAKFDVVRLRTDTSAAATFYRSMGFLPVNSPDATQQLMLAGRASRSG